MHPTLRAAILASLVASAPVASRAADVTPEQARALEGQLRGWFASVAGPGLPLASSPIQVSPEGDHYRLTIPLAGSVTQVKSLPSVTANARPGQGGQWMIDGLKVQTPATFVINTPAPPAKPGEKAKPAVPTTYMVDYATQEGGGTWDPTFAAPSVIRTNSTGFRMTADSAAAKSVSTIESTASTMTLRPVADNRVDFSLDVTGTGFSQDNKAAGAGVEGAATQVGARQVKVQAAMPGVSRERSAQIIPALVRLTFSSSTPPSSKVPLDAEGLRLRARDPEGVRLLIQAMQGFASGLILSEVLDDLTIKGTGFNASMAQLRLGLDAKADDGFLAGNMDVRMDGLALPGMGLDAFADLLPSRVALRPVVSHVPTKELLALLQAAGEDPNGKPPPAQVAALFGQGPLKTGLENFALDMGGASFAGQADVTVPSPTQVSGTAQVTATNVDALLAKVQANPALAQAVPVIVFAKGIGRTEGGKMVWDMQFDSTKLLVNGVDLLKMGGK